MFCSLFVIINGSVNMYKHMGKVVVKILQGSAVTQTVLGGLTIYLLVANFLQCICAKKYGNWLTVDKVITKIIWLTFFGPPCRLHYSPHCNLMVIINGTRK